MRFMNRLLSAIVAASSLVFALPVRADDASLQKSDESGEHVLVARDSNEASRGQRSQRSEMQKASPVKGESDQAASQAKSGTKSNIDDAFSDPILSSGP
jgi:hypothetical protein